MKQSTRAIALFAGVSIALVGITLTNAYIRRPVPIPAPQYADSLAGVIARLYPDRADSADIAKVRWFQSPEKFLGLYWISSDQYKYRDSSLSGLAPAVGQADIKEFTIVVAKGCMDVFIAKHELAHLLLHEAGHPPDVFAKIEGYYGR